MPYDKSGPAPAMCLYRVISNLDLVKKRTQTTKVIVKKSFKNLFYTFPINYRTDFHHEKYTCSYNKTMCFECSKFMKQPTNCTK